jgi:DHA2 family multidrug resistance protein
MAEAHVLPPAKRALVTITVMAATLMVVLDTTIANVALPHMQAALGANSETIAWVLTSYIIASAIAMPLTGWVEDRFGRRWLFTVSVAGFTLSSVLCGVSASLPFMVAARVAQGVFGAALVPLAQAMMYDINPPERHARAMTVWGIGIMVGPIMGPVFGGWLTETWNWRWIFFINLPIGIATGIAGWALLSDHARSPRKFDFLGFGLLAVMLGSFQLMLDRGTQLDWFESTEIIVEAGLAGAALWMFVIHMATARHPIVHAGLFRDRNFVAALVLGAAIGGVMMSGAALVAPMLQRLMEFPVQTAGLVLAPRGLGTMAGMIIAGRLTNKIDPRIMIVAGLLLVAWSLHIMSGFELGMDTRPILSSGFIQGLGIGVTMLPVNLLAFATLPAAMRTEAAAFYGLLRNIGGSIAIAVTAALLASNLQASHGDLGAHVTAVTLPFLTGTIEQFGMPNEVPMAMLDAEINRQALMIAYLDDFWLMMWVTVLVCPLVLLMRPARRAAETPNLAME